ncbi:hypothetical protein LEP1GSC193_2777 [Leptospira alstonii serovar Pingchang str. 80-412]|uniref:Uncharacterized protein n=1 Tax=Leptospira alstonii serovar Pingchang str. 80-412 TaxID=1218564 RepID=T0FZ28_9LEPT|nr:hypothetical protein LEP1GSC193_2777 [Leptospira alstonii serovar Pingchang str. 80-412]
MSSGRHSPEFPRDRLDWPPDLSKLFYVESTLICNKENLPFKREFSITNAKAIVVEIPKELERKARSRASPLYEICERFAQTFLR